MNQPDRAHLAHSARSRRAGLAALLAVLVSASCGGGTEVLFVPYFSFVFQDSAQTISLSLKGQDDCSTQGTLPSGANMGFGGNTANLTGNYDGRNVRITLSKALGAYSGSYDGVFTDVNTLAFTPSAGSNGKPFTVVRQLNGGALRTCP